MMIISSQQFIDWDIVDEKMEQMEAEGCEKIVVPCWYIGEIDGVEYAMQNDAHHTLQAAKQLGLEIEYEITDDPEGLTGEALMDARHMGDEWYNVETSDLAEAKINLVW